jgi:hypothetical protein
MLMLKRRAARRFGELDAQRYEVQLPRSAERPAA